ncbi:MAG: hypothetical protein P1V97_02760 [Planctomycetota bacterium]|nr:hypothetical protein [Planctomycetota bacterium]
MSQVPITPAIGLPSRSKMISSSIKASMAYNNKRQKARNNLGARQDLVKDLGEALVRVVAVEVTEFGLKRALRRQIAKRVARRAGGHVFKGVLRSNAVTAAACFLVDQGIDTAQLMRGRIDKKEYRRRSAENTGGAVGGLGGAATGATLGTFLCPGIGTTLGGIVGGLIGGIGGAHKTGQAFHKK